MMRKSGVALLLLLVSVGVTNPALAADAPAAKDLVGKLVKSGVCANLQLVDARKREVVCTPRGTTIPIRVTAMPSASAMRRALEAERQETCDLLADLGTPMADRTLSFPVGRTWFAQVDFRSVSLDQVAKILGGKVQTYRCT